MTAWSDLVGKLVKENPGTPLNVILPMAKKQYVKPEMNDKKQMNDKKHMRRTNNRRRNRGRYTRRRQRR